MENIKKAIELIKDANNIVAFTGAGASTESGIPDFRTSTNSAKEASKEYPFEVLLSHSFFRENTDVFYDFYRKNMMFEGAKPNDGHKALAYLESLGKLTAVITQNIDGLHQLAGSKNVIELHGSTYRNYCVDCGKRFELSYITNSKVITPKCDQCGGIVRPDVVLYEEYLEEKNLEKATNYIRHAEVMLVVGTSLVVYPAAGLLNYYQGNKLILINKSATTFDTSASLLINGNAGEVLKAISSQI